MINLDKIKSNPHIYSAAKKTDNVLKKIMGPLYSKTIYKLKKNIKYRSYKWKSCSDGISATNFRYMKWGFDQPSPLLEDKLLKVSIVVPNYNHAPYLKERLDSIYNQTYKNYEVILLDDCSTDNSREILEKYAAKYTENTKCYFNKTNSGTVFNQWLKGIELATGDLIWIAESDDWCDSNFLDELVSYFQYESINLAFARSVFMKNGKETWNTEEYLSDISGFQWTDPFVMTANLLVKNAFAIKNVIPNVSSALFRNPGSIDSGIKETCKNMKLSSDWMLYLYLARGGCVAYTNKTSNFYRIHEESTSLKIQFQERYYQEYEKVSAYVACNYKVDSKVFERIEKNLLQHYYDLHGEDGTEIVKKNYSVDKLRELQKERKPNILMACFSLQSGGGETYPLYLANEMSEQGLCVTVIDFHMEKTQEDIRKLLNPRIPIIRIRGNDYIANIITQLGGEVVHSHHACVDTIIGKWIADNDLGCNHYITLHGMYETINDENRLPTIETVMKSCKHFVYIADKNLTPFAMCGINDFSRFTKMANGLPLIPVNILERKNYQIEEDSFLICLVSRGIPEKGWSEAIQAVEKARKKSTRHIELVIIGDGEIKGQLEREAPEYIHFMGVRNNVRDFYSMSNLCILPTRFSGESYPLVIIEALQCGIPVLATDIAEIKNQLTDENGMLAGELLSIKDGQLDVDEIANKIVKFAEDNVYYQLLKSRCFSASKKFDITGIVKDYLRIYQKDFENERKN